MPRQQKESAGTRAAFGRRRPWEAQLRLTAYRALRLAGTRYTRAFPDYFEFYPSVKSAKEFSDLSARVNCYLGGAGVPLYLPGPRYATDPSLVPNFDPTFVRDPGWVSQRPPGDPYLVIHRTTAGAVARVAANRGPSKIVDPNLHMRAENMYFDLRNNTTWPNYAPIEEGLRRLQLLATNGGSAFILATGPSALTVDAQAVAADIRITCNSAVRDLDRIRQFRPNVICFMDPVFHFGPSRYATGFRRDMVRAAEEVDALVVCGKAFAGPLLDMYPQLAERLVVVPHQDGGPWRWPTRSNPTVRQSGNVMTTLMLPLALMLADRVEIAGADGRQPAENYYWKHNPQLQYSDELMQTVFDSHPAFFRDRDYADYYDEFCADMEALCALGERSGKTVRAAAPSWIPALSRRGAASPVLGS